MIVAGDTGQAELPPVARHVDAEMLRISGSFDWLRSVTPFDTQQLWEDFKAAGCRGTPRFRYPGPGIDIASTRELLLGLPIREIEEPVFKALLSEKQRELDRQLELVGESVGYLARGVGPRLPVKGDIGDSDLAAHHERNAGSIEQSRQDEDETDLYEDGPDQPERGGVH